MAVSSLAVAGPAMACDLHGPGQLGGFHRYNPFASALQQFPEAPATAQSAAAEDAPIARKEDTKAKEEAKRRLEALVDEDKSGAGRDSASDKDSREAAQEGRGNPF
ncbi:MAG: hypothetical protein AAFO28_03920 [Pseudomonadota bacterium]